MISLSLPTKPNSYIRSKILQITISLFYIFYNFLKNDRPCLGSMILTFPVSSLARGHKQSIESP